MGAACGERVAAGGVAGWERVAAGTRVELNAPAAALAPAVERVAAGGVAGGERVAVGAFVRAALIATRGVSVSKATNVASGIKNACPDKGARIVFL